MHSALRFSALLIPALFTVQVSAQAPSSAATAVDFSHQVAPVLKELCSGCHMGDKKKGAFSLNTHTSFLAGSENGEVFNPAAPAKSRMLEVLFSSDPDVVMPPPEKNRPRPTAQQLEVLRQWLLTGALWESGFAFQKPSYNAPLKPRLPELPPATPELTNPIDRLLSAYFKSHALPPPSLADDSTFARRASLDLVGLLPDPKVLTTFLADSSEDKRTRFIDSLLQQSTAYADHWMTFWNDLLRNDYGGTGFITGGRKQISNWLYQSLVTNKPYHQMVREIVQPSAETEGFALGITWRGTVSASQTREVQFAQSVSQSFLGINMKCASCHDSFIDHWKLTDAYGLAAIYAEKPVEIARCEKLTGKTAIPAWPFPELGQITPDAPRDERLRQLASLITHPDNGWFARTIVNRLWAALLGRGLVHPVDAMGTEPWSEPLLDYLGWDLAQNGFDLKKTLRLIASSRAYQAQVVARVKDDDSIPFVFHGPRAKRMTAEQFVDSVWQITATAPDTWDAPVRRGSPDPKQIASNPLEASWVSLPNSKANPQTKSRARGLVAVRKTFSLPSRSIQALGIAAGSPSLRLVLNGSEVKGAGFQHFGAVSEIRLTNQLTKGENTIVLLVPSAEADTFSALLSLEIRFEDGKSLRLSTDLSWEASAAWTEDLVKGGKQEQKKADLPPSSWTPVASGLQPTPPELSLESLRHDFAWAIQQKPPARAGLLKSDLLMRTLGRPNRDQIVTSRPQDLSTLEALDLSAGARLSDILNKGASRIAAASKQTPGAVVEDVFHRALSRAPSQRERAAAVEMLGSNPSVALIEDFLWAVCVLPEFQLIR